MSAALVAQTTQQHGLRDDLESSIYVLLWVALTYSATSSPEHAVLFMKTVLEPPPVGQLGFFSKAHFLIARTFLKSVNFLGWPVLDKLIYELSTLFGTWYITPPSAEDETHAEMIRILASNDPTYLDVYSRGQANTTKKVNFVTDPRKCSENI